ncbi:DUF427 domain-containing protein [Nocardia sp. NPDC050710]|uniref:DUF427 domain-containing protein n=1 Tax=Nocardia sp. NPDC050710 TaxID=3157220 RepID=UPI00340DCE07
MVLQLGQLFMRSLGELRYEPTAKRVRAVVDGTAVVDSRRAILVWEPSRLVPSYAVPVDDVLVEMLPAPESADGPTNPVRVEAGGPPVLDPRTPFAVHTCAGEPRTLRTPGGDRVGVGFQLADPGVAGYVVLDFAGFDGWLEEEEPIVGHPRDPFKRIDVRRSSQLVRVECGGWVLGESERPRMLFETYLPVRYYLPRDDIRTDLLIESETTSLCAYKGEATYWSARIGDETVADVAWTYRYPLTDAIEVRDMVAFFTERLDLFLDDELQPRPTTPWS